MDDNITYPSLEDVKRRVIAAICGLYRHDRELLTADASERSITHKLAEHLQREFPYWHVDCEYNRFGSEPKRIPRTLESAPATGPEAIEAVTVFPDIIVHRRRTEQNLLVIEVKKTGEGTKWDKEKLKTFVQSSYHYRYGLLLILHGNGGPKLLLYCDGQESEQWTEDLRSALGSLGYAPE